MRKILVYLVLLPLFGRLAASQQTSRVEVFGGYSLEHVSACGASGDTFLTCSQFIETGYSSAANYNGWNASLTAFLYKTLGITADFAGHYGTTVINGDGGPSATTSRYSFMAGPVAALRARSFTPFAHALFGGVFNKFGSFATGPEESANVPSYTKFAWAIGGGLDQSITRHLAVRWGQFDYERVGAPAAYSSYPSVSGFRFSAGIVLRP